MHLFNQNFSVKTGFYFVPTRLACQHGIKDNFHRYPSDSGCQSNNEADSFKLKKVVFLKIFLEFFMGFRLLDFNYLIQFFISKIAVYKHKQHFQFFPDFVKAYQTSTVLLPCPENQQCFAKVKT